MFVILQKWPSFFIYELNLRNLHWQALVVVLIYKKNEHYLHNFEAMLTKMGFCNGTKIIF
jgi:hypothetical protein